MSLPGVAGKVNYGGICTLGVGQIEATCPLGFLERALAAREALPQFWPSVALAVLSVILLGRAFCAWICPTALLAARFSDQGIGPKPRDGSRPDREAAPKGVSWAAHSSYAVLAGALLSSFLFGFPVFCFLCPVGLFFGLLFAVIRLASPDPLSPGLVLFPLLLGIELLVLKSWCRTLCPLGALLSLAGNLNRFLLPTVRKGECLTSKGVDCRVCERVCPEGISLIKLGRTFAPNSCTKCLECLGKCPGGAVELPLLR